jgi:hypothetical protein
MSNANTGGPAFPYTEANGANSGDVGMTLRDYFAAKAMAAMYATSFEWESTGEPRTPADTAEIEEMAIDAYGIADAMLKARDAK